MCMTMKKLRKDLICVNVFGYDNKIFPLHISKKNSNKVHDMLLIIEVINSQYVFIKDFNALIFNKIKDGQKNGSVKVVYNILLKKKY